MGIKPTYIKAIGSDLLKDHIEHFSGDFEQNKVAVAKTTNIVSKRVRNRVAGYITRKINTKRIS
ncbi:MAG: 30S ribosomal protein S17e [Methanospirillaceae archaeon]|nr:30S ribosomal protein S17e [Methanospirillaceae archaeon]